MEDVKNFVPDFVEQEQEREIIIKLGHMVTNRIPYKLKLKKLTKYDPEYWGLSLLLTDEQAATAEFMVNVGETEALYQDIWMEFKQQ